MHHGDASVMLMLFVSVGLLVRGIIRLINYDNCMSSQVIVLQMVNCNMHLYHIVFNL